MDIVNIEQSLIGAIIDKPGTLEKVIGTLKAEDFSNKSHRQIYAAIESLYRDDKPYDFVSLSSELYACKHLDEIGGRAYLANCIQGYGTESSAPYWAKRIRANAVKTKTKLATASFLSEISNGHSSDIDTQLGDFIYQLTELQSQTMGNELLTIQEIGYETAQELEGLAKGKVKGVMTGFAPLDEAVGGFYPGELVIIAGDSGVGKTNFANQIIDRMAIEDGLPSLIIPLEMRQTALYKRFILGRTNNISAYRLRTGKLTDREWDEFSRVSAILANGVIVMPKKHDLKFTDIQSLVYAAKVEYDIKVLVIDYFQLISLDTNLTEIQAQTYLSRALKNLVLKYGLVGIVLSQFRKRATGTKGLRTLDDIRGSGAIGNDADFVFYIHRDKKENTNKYENTGYIEMPKGREAETDYWEVYYQHPRYYPQAKN